jgi:hypothetical protein
VRRHLFFVPVLLAAATLSPSAGAAADPLQTRAAEVRYAVAAALGYATDHGTYKGMTVAKLRRYDRKIKNIAVRRANKRGFCIESTKRPFVHLNGPGGTARTGRCNVRGVEVPDPNEKPPPPPPATPQDVIRYATPAIAAYGADNGSYTGMTIDGLRFWDASITDALRIMWATRTSFCVESGTGADTYHKAGPGAAVLPGPCPAQPA